MTFLDMFETGHSHNQMSFSDPKYDGMVKSWNGINERCEKRWEELGKAEKHYLKKM